MLKNIQQILKGGLPVFHFSPFWKILRGKILYYIEHSFPLYITPSVTSSGILYNRQMAEGTEPKWMTDKWVANLTAVPFQMVVMDGWLLWKKL